MYIDKQIITTCCESINENTHTRESKGGFDSTNKTKASGITRDCSNALVIIICNVHQTYYFFSFNVLHTQRGNLMYFLQKLSICGLIKLIGYNYNCYNWFHT